MPSIDSLRGVKLKIERANSHIPEVNTLLDFLLAPDSHEVTREVDTAKGEIRHKIRLIKQPPVMVGVVCGEILYGLRCPARTATRNPSLSRSGRRIVPSNGTPIQVIWQSISCGTLRSVCARTDEEYFPHLLPI